MPLVWVAAAVSGTTPFVYPSSMVDTRECSFSLLSRIDPLASGGVFSSWETGRSRVFEPMLERVPFTEGLVDFELVTAWRSPG